MKKLIAYLFVGSILISACDKIDNPIPSDATQSIGGGDVEFIPEPSLGLDDSTKVLAFINNGTWTEKKAADNSSQKFIVLEEFTGHECIFCPAGTREILRLDELFGDQLIPVGIHAGGFARPRSSGTKYRTDFRVDGNHGEDYLAAFNPGNAYPRGMVNRKGGNSTGSSQWGIDINAIKDDAPIASLKLTNYLDEAAGNLRVNLEIEWLQASTESYKLQLYLVEDHIIDWQKDGSDEISDYDHRHVLRQVVNNTFGKTLKPVAVGETETIEYILPVNSAWKKEDLESVAFIFNADPASYEVVQGNAAHIK